MNVDYFYSSIMLNYLSYCLICYVALAAVLGCDANL